MKILEKLFKREDKDSSDGLEQQEREAILDLLLFGIYADNHLSLAEDRIIKEEIERLDWASGTSVDFYMASATDRARSALRSPQKEREFLESLRDRLQSEVARKRAMGLLASLFHSDGEVQAEKAFADKVSSCLSA